MGLTRPRQRPGRTAAEDEAAELITDSPKSSEGGKSTLLYSKRRCPSSFLILLVVTSVGCLFLLQTLQHRAIELPALQKPQLSQFTHQSPTVPISSNAIPSKIHESRNEKILTLFLETPTLPLRWSKKGPLPLRKTSAAALTVQTFPDFQPSCKAGIPTSKNFPVDTFPNTDPFLPWIHDYFVKDDSVRFVAQNKRRCDTGDERADIMRHMEPQISLLQPVPVRAVHLANGTVQYELTDPARATANETRFVCRFHDQDGTSAESLSAYPFNYEYVAWRKHNKPMFVDKGRDVEHFEYSQLMFRCPIPVEFRKALSSQTALDADAPNLWLDLIPIRTPARREFLLTPEQTGPVEWPSVKVFNATQHFEGHVLPAIKDSGRWANLPLCPEVKTTQRRDSPTSVSLTEPTTSRNRFVACTWTAASYHRRGDAVTVDDSAKRLKEWIAFHKLVGLDHIYIYDNTQVSEDGTASPLQAIANQYPDFVTLHPWPFKVCNNNRPNHNNPGERSSQYAAEASCRERYGPDTDWMAFIDTDEYLVTNRESSWESVLQEAEAKSVHVLKMRSSRGKPRVDLMESTNDPAVCDPTISKTRLPTEPCIVPRRNETFLRVYNCDYIRPPRPDRFARAMKQIYRPAFVLSHFVHYATINFNIARYYKDTPDESNFGRRVKASEWGDAFLDELKDGVLIHTKSVLPHETMTRNATCQLGSKHTCAVGHVCPDSLPFDDKLHQKNVFRDEHDEFCNCWINRHVEDYLLPKLEEALRESLD